MQMRGRRGNQEGWNGFGFGSVCHGGGGWKWSSAFGFEEVPRCCNGGEDPEREGKGREKSSPHHAQILQSVGGGSVEERVAGRGVVEAGKGASLAVGWVHARLCAERGGRVVVFLVVWVGRPGALAEDGVIGGDGGFAFEGHGLGKGEELLRVDGWGRWFGVEEGISKILCEIDLP